MSSFYPFTANRNLRSGHASYYITVFISSFSCVYVPQQHFWYKANTEKWQCGTLKTDMAPVPI
jgi:hypothetical protein